MKHLYRVGRADIEDVSVAFTPKGGCPLKLFFLENDHLFLKKSVAFTPKGGCPLKLRGLPAPARGDTGAGSIHPQGWVPIETS